MKNNSLNHSELIDLTIKTWQPYFTQPIGEEEAEEIIYRWSGFLEIIAKTLESEAAVKENSYET